MIDTHAVLETEHLDRRDFITAKRSAYAQQHELGGLVEHDPVLRPLYPADLADKIGVSRQILSNHLACLRGCGLVDYRTEGRQSFYALTRPELMDLLAVAAGSAAARLATRPPNEWPPIATSASVGAWPGSVSCGRCRRRGCGRGDPRSSRRRCGCRRPRCRS